MIEIVKVKQFIVSILNYIPEDYRLHQGDEQNTFLYRLLNGMKEGNFDFYDQAKKLFLRGMTNPRNLRVLFEFPKDNTGLPAYVIRVGCRPRSNQFHRKNEWTDIRWRCMADKRQPFP